MVHGMHPTRTCDPGPCLRSGWPDGAWNAPYADLRSRAVSRFRVAGWCMECTLRGPAIQGRVSVPGGRMVHGMHPTRTCDPGPCLGSGWPDGAWNAAYADL